MINTFQNFHIATRIITTLSYIVVKTTLDFILPSCLFLFPAICFHSSSALYCLHVPFPRLFPKLCYPFQLQLKFNNLMFIFPFVFCFDLCPSAFSFRLVFVTIADILCNRFRLKNYKKQSSKLVLSCLGGQNPREKRNELHREVNQTCSHDTVY